MVKDLEAQMSAYVVRSYSGSDPALSPYKNLIYTSWMNSLRFGNNSHQCLDCSHKDVLRHPSWFKDIDSETYYDVYHQIIDSILNRPESVVRLALLRDDLDTCLGWGISEGNTLHYVFVKGDIQARRHGIGTSLLPKEFTHISHLTTVGRHIWKKKYPDVKFNPFL